MATGYTAFITYILVPSGLTSGYGYSEAIHCNYIETLSLQNNPYIQKININFPEISDFKFLSTGITTGTGFTANKIYALVQLVSGLTDSTTTITPLSQNWKMFDITSQIPGHVSGVAITPAELVSTVFSIPLLNYTGFTTYNLSYLTYPNALVGDDSKLCFGDETYFMGNVTSNIYADVYTTNLSIMLPLNQFNSSTNPTWTAMTTKPPVAITEIGIYDADMNLVGIGKLNDPLIKDATISRTILFAIDF